MQFAARTWNQALLREVARTDLRRVGIIGESACSLCTSIPIYLMLLVIKGVLSGRVELNTQNPTPKGAPFYIVQEGLRPAKMNESPGSNQFVFSTGRRLSTLRRVA